MGRVSQSFDLRNLFIASESIFYNIIRDPLCRAELS